jgi:hypothetical protein
MLNTATGIHSRIKVSLWKQAWLRDKSFLTVWQRYPFYIESKLIDEKVITAI